MSGPHGAKLTIYVDPVSPYSWFGFTNTIRFRPQLQAHGVEVDIIPFFLGGARDKAGNPWQPTPKVKQAMGAQDTALTGKLLGLKVVPPKVFPIASLLPVRVATWVKDNYPASIFDQTFPAFSEGYWSKSINISTPDGIAEALQHVFSAEEITKIIAGASSAANKKKVIDQTMAPGAYGAPWIVAINTDGERKDWFGNDRWDQVFHHLGVPYSPVTILPPGSSVSKL
ncbi:Hypothetical protein R9X50_00190900 [Acrodontium crateriforme]|uniref:DSBA-like thioredoxin domain-containing protein n=1 Tax=Acrodontium crateriforme TaxID=150365 RepID=A0AAQ3R872_9PEZI|nr:Hypothetical protein R9X50_00190900 [Acrodontium crateriforme]